jgi:hypothetical protein
LSAVRDYLFIVFAATRISGSRPVHPQLEDATYCGARESLSLPRTTVIEWQASLSFSILQNYIDGLLYIYIHVKLSYRISHVQYRTVHKRRDVPYKTHSCASKYQRYNVPYKLQSRAAIHERYNVS